MPHLLQLLADHGSLLIVDACSERVQVGVWSRSGDERWVESKDEAGVGIFRCIEELAINPLQLGAYVYCDGPGSILGVRTSSMAIRTWCELEAKPVFRYHSLELVAHATNDLELTIIADARRESWHCSTVGRPLQRVPAAELTGPLAMPEGFRHWTPLPAGVRRVPYSVRALLHQASSVDLLLPTDSPDAFMYEEPRYVTWTPSIHRAP